MDSWRVGRDGLLRPFIARFALGFWSQHDADLWVNQRLLVHHVLRRLPGTDKDTVRRVLADMVRHALLIRARPRPTRILYRISGRYADPTAAGFAREITEVLVDPIDWVTRAGLFLRAGKRAGNGPWRYPVATFPHHFTKHGWMRAWIRALKGGHFARPQAALASVAAAARDAPLRLLWSLWRARRPDGPLAEAARLFESTRLWRGTRRDFADEHTARTSTPPPGAPETAIRLLHELCGHHHLEPLLGRPMLSVSRQILPEPYVYEELDRLVAVRLGQRVQARPPPKEDAPPHAAAAFPIPADPLLDELEEEVRALDPALRATLTDHRRAWPGGVISMGKPAGDPPPS